ncbi:hypothetical protein [Glutamicibacter ardleyensis]|uniref:hypothetical protein n=1 Tax=Glutamicibacter ardleyensis TaxID=225894 RepID=UPI00166B27A4|nr:hypothetical protein [Glutamicibacter ardleyensis]
MSAQVVWPFRDKSTMNLHYPEAGVKSGLLNSECEAVYEYFDGTNWVEPLDSRFRLSGKDRDRLEQTPTTRFDFISLIPSMLESAYVWDDGGMETDTDGNILFSAASPGRILRTLILNAQTRGWGTALDMDFTDTRDSNGALWTSSINLSLNPTQTLFEVLSALGNQGVVDWAGQGRTLRVFNPDTFLGRDRTAIRLLAGQGETSAPEQTSYRDRATVLRVVGESGEKWDRPNGTSPWGRLESIMSAGGVADQGTAFLLSDEELLKLSGARVSRTREFDQDSKYLPHRDYRAGDHVSYQTGTGMESMRVFSLSVTVENRLTGYAVLGDRFEDALIAAARKQNSLVIGRVNGGNGQQPSPESDTRTPAVPAGFLGSSSAYMDAEGNEMGQVSLGWTHTGKATDGTAIEIDRFEFMTRVSAVGAKYKSFRSVPGAERAASFSPIRVRKENNSPEFYDYAIRAVAASSRVSPWVYLNGLMMETDTTPPPVPSAPVGVASYGTVIVTWDGLGAGGETMPPDFLHTETEVGTSPAGPWQFAGNFERAGAFPIPFKLDYGTYWLRLRSVDRVGNKSEWSALSEVTTTPLVDLPDVHDLIDEWNQKLAEALDGVGQALNSANGKNKVTHSTSLPSINGGEVDGDVWWRYSNSQMNILIGTWQFSGGAWKPHSFGHQTLDSIDLGKATVGMLDGIYIKVKSLSAEHIMVGDFTNLTTIDPLANVNVTTPAAFSTVAAGGYTYKADGGSEYLMFLDQTGPVPFESGDWLRVSFDALATTEVDVPTTLFVYPNKTGISGSVSAAGETVTITPTVQHYAFDIEVPDLSSIGGGRSWILGLVGANARAVGVRNVRAYKKTNATTIAPDSIRTPMLGADIIEAYHIKSNTIETDNMIGGFADFIVISGSLIQTRILADRGIKLDGFDNRMRAWNDLGEQTLNINGESGDIWLGKGGQFRVWGDTGDTWIGNGTFKVDGTTGSLDIGYGKFLVDGTTGNVLMENATLTAGVVRTSSTANRGLRMDSNGLRGWNTDGVQRFSLDPNTGRIVAEGEFSTSTAGRRVRISDTNLTAAVAMYADETDKRGSIYAVKPESSNQVQTVYRMHGDASQAFAFQYAMTENTWRIGTNDTEFFIGYGPSGAPTADTYVESPVIFARGYSLTANMVITSNGIIGMATSAARYKLDVQPLELSDQLLDIEVKDWLDRTTREEQLELDFMGVRTMEQQERFENRAPEVRIPGVIAEHVAAVPGGRSFVAFNADGEEQSVAYDRLAIAQIAVLNRQLKEERARSDGLEDRLTALEALLTK